MGRRGRRPHPDILTPREWEVLSLVREGLSNPQIGERLGISADAAKYHVSEILSKLGVASREEAAAWLPEPAVAPVFRPVWARALGRWWPALAWAGAALSLAVVGLLLWGVLRSNGNDGSVANSVTPTPPPAGEQTRELAGIKFYTWDAWNAAGLGGCPSQNPEGPFLGPAVFSVSDADLASIPVQDKQTIRMCKLGGITVLSFPSSNAQIELVAGAAQWPSYVPLDSLTVQGDVVVAPSPIITDKNTVLAGNTAVKAAPFGLVVANSGASKDAAVAALASIDASQISMPLGKDLFTGDIAGIHFESEFNPAASAQCFYGAYGLGSGSEPIVTPSDTRVQIEPGYLPPGARPLTTITYRKCGDQESAEITYFFSATTQGQYWIVRKSGTPEWVSIYAEDWYSPITVAGLDAVLVSPPPGITGDSGAELFVHEAFGLTAIYGPDPAELVKIAEGLNR